MAIVPRLLGAHRYRARHYQHAPLALGTTCTAGAWAGAGGHRSCRRCRAEIQAMLQMRLHVENRRGRAAAGGAEQRPSGCPETFPALRLWHGPQMLRMKSMLAFGQVDLWTFRPRASPSTLAGPRGTTATYALSAQPLVSQSLQAGIQAIHTKSVEYKSTGEGHTVGRAHRKLQEACRQLQYGLKLRLLCWLPTK